MTVRKRTEKMNAVCEQSEWDEMEAARPGLHQLVCGGIASEAEAELLARSKFNEVKPAKW